MFDLLLFCKGKVVASKNGTTIQSRKAADGAYLEVCKKNGQLQLVKHKGHSGSKAKSKTSGSSSGSSKRGTSGSSNGKMDENQQQTTNKDAKAKQEPGTHKGPNQDHSAREVNQAKDGDHGADKEQRKATKNQKAGKNGNKEGKEKKSGAQKSNNSKHDPESGPDNGAKQTSPIASSRLNLQEYRELHEDDVFTSDELRLIVEIMEDDRLSSWQRIASVFFDKTGKTVHPDVFRIKFGAG